MNRKLMAFACLSWSLAVPVLIASGDHLNHPTLAHVMSGALTVGLVIELWKEIQDTSQIGTYLDRAFGFLALVLGFLLTFGFAPIGKNAVVYVMLAISFYVGCRLLMVPPTPAQLANK